MKKILINITNGFSLRYLCHTEILKTLLKNKNIKIFILSNNAETTKKNLGFENVVYLTLNEKTLKKYQISSRLYNFLEILRLYTHGGQYSTPSVMFNYLSIGKKKKFFLKLIIFFLKQSRKLRKLMLLLQSKYYPDEIYQLIKKINPDLILTSSLGVFSYDEYIIRSAKALNIKSCACILSWDNSTTRGYPGALTDLVIAWTKNMKKELQIFSDCKEENIYEGGIAHFDNYYRQREYTDQFSLHKMFDIDKNKKIIFFVTKGPSTFQFNPNIADLICKNIESQKISNAHLITRIHPLFYKIESNNLEFQDALDVFEKLDKKYNCLTIDYPKITSLQQNFEMDKNEQSYLKNMIVNSDVIVNIFSTLNIEGAIFDKPLINIDFDNFKPMYKWNKKFERQSLSIDRALDHNSRIMTYNGILNTKSEYELIEGINLYLNKPDYLSEGRKKIKDNEAGINQGVAGKSIAEKIISFL